MNNYKEYIGKTFKGFKFEHSPEKQHYYDEKMDKLLGQFIKIEGYHEQHNFFYTDTVCWYPADLVIAQLKKQETENKTFKPKRGDKVLVWNNHEENAIECIFLTEIEGTKYPYICVTQSEEEKFINGNVFDIAFWKNMKPLPEKEIAKDTLVWCKNNEISLWVQMYYSHFSGGKHYCFINQKKSSETEDTRLCNIVTTENPFE
jgi:hypothetical protein